MPTSLLVVGFKIDAVHRRNPAIQRSANNFFQARRTRALSDVGHSLMLPNVRNGSARRCSAVARSTGQTCRKAAVTGCKTCKSHGGHKRVRREKNHWNYQGAGQTQAERQERQAMSVFFHETENLMSRLGMMAPGSTRTRGRKPRKN